MFKLVWFLKFTQQKPIIERSLSEEDNYLVDEIGGSRTSEQQQRESAGIIEAQSAQNFTNEQSGANKSLFGAATDSSTLSSSPFLRQSEGYLEVKKGRKLLRDANKITNDNRMAAPQFVRLEELPSNNSNATSSPPSSSSPSAFERDFFRETLSLRPDRKQSTLMGSNSRGGGEREVKSATLALSQKPSIFSSSSASSLLAAKQADKLLGSNLTRQTQSNNKKSPETSDAQPIEQPKSVKSGAISSSFAAPASTNSKEINQTLELNSGARIESAKKDPDSAGSNSKGKAQVAGIVAAATTQKGFAAQSQLSPFGFFPSSNTASNLSSSSTSPFKHSKKQNETLLAGLESVNLENGRGARKNLNQKLKSHDKDNQTNSNRETMENSEKNQQSIFSKQAFESAVEKQVLERFNSNSSFIKELSRQLSAYYGLPVSIETSIDRDGERDGSSSASRESWNSPTPSKPRAVLLRRKRHAAFFRRQKAATTFGRSVKSLQARFGWT